MVNTRSQHEGTEAPAFVALPATTRASKGKSRRKASDSSDGRAEGDEWERHAGMPGGFSPNVNIGGQDCPVVSMDDEDERRVSEDIASPVRAGVASSVTAMQTPLEVCAGQSDLSPSTERAGQPGLSPCTTIRGDSQELHLAESTLATPFQTPKRTAQVQILGGTAPISGPRIFPHVFDTGNTYMRETNKIDDTEKGSEDRSDETLKQTKPAKKISERQQRAEDLAFLQAIIDDRKRCRRLRALLPELKRNDKSLLTEIQEALETSGEEFSMSDWDLSYDEEEEPAKTHEKSESPLAGPSYFEKGKWVSNEEHDAREQYKQQRLAAEERTRKTADAGARTEGRVKVAKKPRPSVGIVIDDVRRPPVSETTSRRAYIIENDIDASIAMMPPGSYLAAKLRAQNTSQSRLEKSRSHHRRIELTSDSESSQSHSSSSQSSRSSRTERNRRKREKYREKAKKAKKELEQFKRSGLKSKLPTPYKGNDNLRDYELWNYEIDEWLEDTGYKGHQAVRKIGGFLREKAARWYMDFVAPEPYAWDIGAIKAGLYRYCFPPDMKERIRREFQQARQGNRKFIEYLQELKHIQRQLPDITDRQVCIKLWNSVHAYIKAEWARSGMNAEDTSLEALCREAERIEAAETIRRQYAPRREHFRNIQSRQNEQRTDEGRDQPSGSQPKEAKPQKSQNKDKGPRPKTDKPAKMTREERDALRAEGKCFKCKETGHTMKDCPKRNTAKPSGLYSSAIRYDAIEELRKQRDESYISLASIRLEADYLSEGSDSTVFEEISAGDSLLNEILEQITPYSSIVIAEDDKLRATSEDLQTVEIPYQEIAENVLELYLERVRERNRKDAENNGYDIVDWSDSDVETKEEASSPAETQNARIQLNAIGIKGKKRQPTQQALERNASSPKDITRRMPKPLIVLAKLNGHEVRVLLDTGSLGDFISTTVVDQLKIRRDTLEKPIGLQMAVAGSRSAINQTVVAQIQYQTIDCMRRFDVINIDRYDVILGTPFLFQHQVILSINPPGVSIGSPDPLPIQGELALELESRAAELYEEELERCREELRRAGADLCKTMAETSLPPFRAINHTIPLIDEKKQYHTRSVQCPAPLEHLWKEKYDAYINTGRWEFRPGNNAVPMLMLLKKSKDGKQALRTVLDKREINANTVKLASPLPDINDILMEVSRHPYRSLIDGKDAYEQIRVIPEHVARTSFMTPNGTMVSHVMQQGDCNAGATYQNLMNHIFAPYIGKFMYVYLDDIIIYSDTLQDHMRHVKMVFDVLRREKLYLSPQKMQLLAERLSILGHVITPEGIAMDPHKVDAIEKWKVPTSKTQVQSFIGAVGYLAPNCPGIRIPMGVLTKVAAATTNWHWGATEQRAFQEVKDIVSEYRNHNRVALDYSPGAPPINLTTDACCTGASGVLSQGDDIKTAKIAAFWSGKFTATQQNYPVHEQELLAIKESLERFQHLLHGTRVRIFTDHKALEYFNSQSKLSARQTRWMEKINEFDIEIHYIPGETNVLADALSRIYSNEPEGVQRSPSELIEDEDEDIKHILVGATRLDHAVLEEETKPLYVGDEVRAELEARTANELPAVRRSTRVRKTVEKYTTKSPSQPPKPRKTKQPKPEQKLKPKERSERAEPTTGDMQNSTETQPSILTKCVTELDVMDCIAKKYKQDTFFKLVLDTPGQHRNFHVEGKAIYMAKDGEKLLCIPNVKVGERSVREILITHAHSILAHLGARKTLQWLRTQVWWPSMVNDVTEYCRACHVCAANKPSTQSPMGLLQAMPIPSYPWQSIGIDFVGPLPESTTRYGSFDMLLVVIDSLTRMIHLIPTKQTYKAKDMAEVLFEHVYKLHGMPERIVSDRDSLFTSDFWTRLAELTKMELRMSSAYHPQTDGMTERANRTIMGLIRIAIMTKQTDWAKHLAGVEFAINLARSDTTGFSPFYLNYGRTPSPITYNKKSEYPGVQKYVEDIKIALMKAHDAIVESRVKMTREANKHRRAAEFEVGDLVYVSTKNIRMPTGFARKLAPKFVGPYKIKREITKGTTYEVDLSKDLKARGIHPVFHVSLLRIHIPMDDRKFPGREYGQIASLGDTPQESAVDRITSHKGKGRNAIFELLWKSGDRTWEPYRVVRHLEALESYCEAQGVKNVKALPPIQENEVETDAEMQVNLIMISTWEDIKGEGETIQEDRRTSNPTLLSHPYSACNTNSDLCCSMSEQSSLTRDILETILKAQNESQAAVLHAVEQAHANSHAAALRTVREANAVFRGRPSPYDRKKRWKRDRDTASKDKASDATGRTGSRKTHRGKRARAAGVSNTGDDQPGAVVDGASIEQQLATGTWPEPYDAPHGAANSIDELLSVAEASIPIPENPPVPAYTPTAENNPTNLPTDPAQNPPEPTIQEIFRAQDTQASFELDFEMDEVPPQH